MIDYLLFGGGMSMLLIGFIWLIQRERIRLNLYFAGMYFTTGFIVLYAWAERTGAIYDAPYLYNAQIPLCFAFAPLIYYGFAQIVELDDRVGGFKWRHFLPAGLSLVAAATVNALNAERIGSLTAGADPGILRDNPAFLAVHALGLASNLYIFWFLTRIIGQGIGLFRVVRMEAVKELRLLLLFVSLFFGDVLLMTVAHVTGNADLLYLAKFLASVTFLFYALYSFYYPEFAQRVVRKAKGLRYRNSQLNGMNVDALLERLEELMRTEKAYRDMDLSLASLSEMLLCTPHQLSEILNDRLKLGFAAYVNQYRVNEASALLLRDRDRTILEIAFAVGFNSKASFNANFQKFTGISPTAFRERGKSRRRGAKQAG